MKKLIFCIYLAIFTSVFSFCNEADNFLFSFVELKADWKLLEEGEQYFKIEPLK